MIQYSRQISKESERAGNSKHVAVSNCAAILCPRSPSLPRAERHDFLDFSARQFVSLFSGHVSVIHSAATS